MSERAKLIISYLLIIALCVFGIVYVRKYQDAERAFLATKVELQIAQDGLIDQIDLNNGLRQRLEQAKEAEETLQALKAEEYEFAYLGNFKLTAYCSCEICCEGYAANRPIDEYGNPLVYTATGAIAKEGRTIGVNPKTIPYGTQVYISGLGWRIAEDTGGGIGTNHIDVYMGSHQAALSSGLTYGDVWVLVKK